MELGSPARSSAARAWGGSGRAASRSDSKGARGVVGVRVHREWAALRASAFDRLPTAGIASDSLLVNRSRTVRRHRPRGFSKTRSDPEHPGDRELLRRTILRSSGGAGLPAPL